MKKNANFSTAFNPIISQNLSLVDKKVPQLNPFTNQGRKQQNKQNDSKKQTNIFQNASNNMSKQIPQLQLFSHSFTSKSSNIFNQSHAPKKQPIFTNYQQPNQRATNPAFIAEANQHGSHQKQTSTPEQNQKITPNPFQPQKKQPTYTDNVIGQKFNKKEKQITINSIKTSKPQNESTSTNQIQTPQNCFSSEGKKQPPFQLPLSSGKTATTSQSLTTKTQVRQENPPLPQKKKDLLSEIQQNIRNELVDCRQPNRKALEKQRDEKRNQIQKAIKQSNNQNIILKNYSQKYTAYAKQHIANLKSKYEQITKKKSQVQRQIKNIENEILKLKQKQIDSTIETYPIEQIQPSVSQQCFTTFISNHLPSTQIVQLHKQVAKTDTQKKQLEDAIKELKIQCKNLQSEYKSKKNQINSISNQIVDIFQDEEIRIYCYENFEKKREALHQKYQKLKMQVKEKREAKPPQYYSSLRISMIH